MQVHGCLQIQFVIGDQAVTAAMPGSGASRAYLYRSGTCGIGCLALLPPPWQMLCCIRDWSAAGTGCSVEEPVGTGASLGMAALRLLGDAAFGNTDFAARMRSAISFWYFCSSLQQWCVLPFNGRPVLAACTHERFMHQSRPFSQDRIGVIAPVLHDLMQMRAVPLWRMLDLSDRRLSLSSPSWCISRSR